MATVQHDSELMTNHVAAVPIASHSSVVTLLHPGHRRPAVLGLSNDLIPEFNLIMEDEHGNRNAKDVRKLLNLGNVEVHSFHAQQDADLRVYLVFATRASTTMSNVYVMKPFMLDNIVIDQYPLVVMQSVESFYVGPPTTDNPYPMVLAAHKQVDRMTDTSNISRIFVSETTVEVLPQFRLPQNPDMIQDMCAASHPAYGVGVWFLTSIQGSMILMGEFAQRDAETARMEYNVFSPACPAGATSIASFVQDDGATGILIGAEAGLFLLDADSGVAQHAKASLISTHSIYAEPQRLIVAQDAKDLTIWSVGKQGDLGYCTTNVGNVSTPAEAFVLIPEHGAANFSVAISQPSQSAGFANISQTLIANDDNGNLSLLQQTRDTGLWKTEPFYVDAAREISDIQSYTISLTAFDQTKVPVASGSLNIKASSTVTAIVNGRPYNISSLGTWLPLDSQGELNLIVSTSGLASQALTLFGLKGPDGNKITFERPEGYVVDPSRKAIEAFRDIGENTDLTKLMTKTGRPLFSGIKSDDMPSSEDLSRAAKCFSQFNTALKDFHPDGTLKRDRDAFVNTTSAVNFEVVGHSLMDGFNFIKHKLSEAKDWLLKKVGQTWHFVCEIAGEIKRFVLDCVEKISESLSWVWHKIKLGIQDLIDFAGFVFSWDDITQCKSTVEGIINGAFDFGSSKINQAETKVEDFFSGLKAQVDKRISPGEMIAAATDSSSDHDDSSVAASRSTSVKWMTERLKNGGMRGGTRLSNDQTTIQQPGESTWESIIEPISDAMMKTVQDVSKDLSQIFHDVGSLTNKTMWQNLGKDLFKDIIDGIKTFVVGLLRVLDKLVINIKKLGNKEISIPVISRLWEKVSGHSLTLTDAVSLIIGLPTCLLMKLVTGRKPPSLPHLDATFLESLFDGQQPDNVKADFALYGSALSVTCSMLANLMNVFMMSYRIEVSGIPAAVSSLSPNKVTLVMKSLISIVSIVVAMPASSELPAADLRHWTGYLAIASVGSKLLFTFTSIGGEESAKKLQILDCIISLANFGLYDAVYAAELKEDAHFKDKDTTISTFGIVENIFNTIVSVARCTAVQAKDKDEKVSLIALGVMLLSSSALVTNKSLTMSRVSQIKGTSSRGVSAVP